MRHRTNLIACLVAVVFAAIFTTAATVGQSTRDVTIATGKTSTNQAGAVWSPSSRTADGQPDISGYWMTQAFQTSLEPGLYAGNAACTGFGDPIGERPTKKMGVVDPPDGKIPMQPWAAERRKLYIDSQTDPKGHVDRLDPNTRCLPSGVPRFDYASPYNGHQFLQREGYVVMFSEWNHLYRIIPLDGRPHVGAGIRMYMGDSRGKWEGNTLVVDVTNFTDKTWFDMVGTFHSSQLHVTERFTRVSPDNIEYEATIDDPAVYTRPWKLFGVFNSARNVEGYQLYEYACVEGSRALENILGVETWERILGFARPMSR